MVRRRSAAARLRRAARRVSGVTETERAIAAAFAAGERLDLTGAREASRTVRGAFLAALLLGDAEPDHGRVPSLQLTGVRITGSFDVAGGTVRWAVALRRCTFEQPIHLPHAATGSFRILDSTAPGLHASWARVGTHLQLDGSTIEGSIDLRGAHVGGELRLNGVRIGGEPSLSGGGLVVDGGMFGRGLVAAGTIRLAGAELRGGLHLQGARIDGPGYALDLPGATVLSIARLTDGFRCPNAVGLLRTRVEGLLSLRGAIVGSVSATGLRADEVDLRVASWLGGTLYLNDATIRMLRDEPATWPERIRLNGVSVGSIGPGGVPPVARRLDWVSRDPSGFRPQPYEELAAFYRRIGQGADARRVLLAKDRARRSGLARHERVVTYLFDWTVGYGYRPWWALGWLAPIAATGTAFYAADPPMPMDPSHAPHFNAFLYTLDLMSPIGGFADATAFNPDTAQQWFGFALTILGWMLVAMLIAGMSSMFKRP